jgi:Colicin V production protein
MSSFNLGLNWFDFLVAAVLLLGVNLGNKRGMSKEVIVFLQWCVIVVVAALFYAPIGQLLSHWTGVGEMTGYVIAYLLLAGIVKMIFSKINRHLGEKLEANHPFGRMEYYFGPVATSVRFACVLLLSMALLHAGRQSSAQNERAVKQQKKDFGEVYFPTLGMVSQEVFVKSTTGKFIADNLSFLLITPSWQRQAKAD